jgi:hypothetical protein
MRGNPDNLQILYERSLEYERTDGSLYYDNQRNRLRARAEGSGLTLGPVIAAFAALSPNNAEATNYRALDTCLDIISGVLPEAAPVIAYPLNKVKALAILRGASIEDTLKGRKVYAFYRNTLDPEDEEFITIDGHMLGAWTGRRFTLRRDAEIKSSEYPVISNHFRSAASCYQLSAPKFQATLWLAWKRIHRILWTPPQLSFGWVGSGFPRRLGFPRKDGQYTQRVISSIPVVQLPLVFDVEPGSIVS